MSYEGKSLSYLLNAELYFTYMVPFGTVMLRPSKMMFGLLVVPYILWARRTHIACCFLVARVEGRDSKNRLRAERSVSGAAGCVGGIPSNSASILIFVCYCF